MSIWRKGGEHYDIRNSSNTLAIVW